MSPAGNAMTLTKNWYINVFRAKLSSNLLILNRPDFVGWSYNHLLCLGKTCKFSTSPHTHCATYSQPFTTFHHQGLFHKLCKFKVDKFCQFSCLPCDWTIKTTPDSLLLALSVDTLGWCLSRWANILEMLPLAQAPSVAQGLHTVTVFFHHFLTAVIIGSTKSKMLPHSSGCAKKSIQESWFSIATIQNWF